VAGFRPGSAKRIRAHPHLLLTGWTLIQVNSRPRGLKIAHPLATLRAPQVDSSVAAHLSISRRIGSASLFQDARPVRSKRSARVKRSPLTYRARHRNIRFVRTPYNRLHRG
jgi:hypothetical protein